MSDAHSTARRPSIYFIRCGDDGPIKIGRTSVDLTARLCNLQTGCPYPLRLFAKIESATHSAELQIHDRFVHLRRLGEWFDPGPDLIAFIAEKADAIAPPILASDRICKAARAAKRTTRRRSPPYPFRGKPGRPVHAHIPAERQRRIEGFRLYIVEGWNTERIAASFGVTRRTVDRWIQAARSYPECSGFIPADPSALRALLARLD